MITLLTGIPGSGKTATAVFELTQMLKRWKKQRQMLIESGEFLAEHLPEDRPLYSFGLNGLKLPHVQLDPERWHETVPHGAIIMIDEVQQVWRPRGSGAKVPDHIAALETHRHKAIDFLLTTQKPRLCDSNVRDLVGRFVIIRNMGMLGRWWYEWPDMEDVGRPRTAPIKKKFKLPKQVFSLYKSASMHIAPQLQLPPVLVVIGLSFLVLLGGGWWVTHRISARTDSAAAEVSVVAPGASVAATDEPSERSPGAGGHRDRQAITAQSIVADFTPRIVSRPDTAPAYDHLRVVVQMPRVVGGYCVGDACRCMTQQGTDAGLSSGDCRAWLASPPFDPYAQSDAQSRQAVQRDVKPAGDFLGSPVSDPKAPSLEPVL